MNRVVSGIRPTGKLHIGNYFGALKNFISLQDQADCFFFIADYHALTTHPNSEELAKNKMHVLAEYLAMGLDPNKSVIYFQSDVPEVAELYLLLNMHAYLGELERVTTFKEKAKSQPDNINAGLLTYPTLMAADILLHKAARVPVGKDQEQHLEMTRKFANRFNHVYNTEFFPAPEAISLSGELVKVPGLSGGGKMSKSSGEADCIYLSDPADLLRKKVLKAVTDSGPTEKNSPVTQPVQNLFDLMKLVSEPQVIDFYANAYAQTTIRYGDFKKQLAEDMERFVGPYREQIAFWLHNPDQLKQVAADGAKKARISAQNTLNSVREIMGLSTIYTLK